MFHGAPRDSDALHPLSSTSTPQKLVQREPVRMEPSVASHFFGDPYEDSAFHSPPPHTERQEVASPEIVRDTISTYAYILRSGR